MPTLRLTVNGTEHAVNVPPRTPLLDVLRDTLGLKGTRFGCGEDLCGACCVLLDGRPTAACTTPVEAAASHAVTTVEGLSEQLRAAFVAEQAAQCGYCSSGMLVGAAALLQREPHPSAAQVGAALDGHLCRCGAHARIVRAVLRAAASAPARNGAHPGDGTSA